MFPRTHAPLSLLLVGLLANGCADEDPGDPMAADEGTTTAAAEEGSSGEAPGSSGEAPGSSGEAPGSSGEAESDTAGSGGTDETTGGGIDVDALYDCEDPDFVVFQPLSGPGIDPATGAFLEPMQDTYVLHTTQILPEPEQLEQFLGLSQAVIQEIAQTDGLVGFALAQEPNCGFFYTMGVWRDEQSMFALVASDSHVQAMTQTAEISITGRTASWTAPADQMPLTWEMAIAAIADVEPLPVYE
jgi:quinol monooxygenase YgiN